jgi:predicted GNAT family acetyltransferase
MEVERFDRPSAFLDRAGSFLTSEEARHNLILGIAGTLVEHPETYPSFELWMVAKGRECLLAAVRTPPFNLILSDAAEDAALDVLIDTLGPVSSEIPGVIGNRPTVDAFVERWRRASGVSVEVRMRLGVFEAWEVHVVPRARGAVGRADSSDRELVGAWVNAFEREAIPHQVIEEEEEDENGDGTDLALGLRLSGDESAGYWLLRVDGEPVSLAGFGGRTPNGIRINAVYTPPEHRRHGYATSLVTQLTEHLLSSGRRFCFLYTDLANPTSNAIYERIGYRRVCESREYAFAG